MSPSHYCALRQAGLFCWGENFLGQLGTGDTQPSDVPVPATVAGADIVEIAAATARTCVRRSSGEVACWGANEKAQIGDGTRISPLTPVAAAGIDDAIALAIDVGSTCVLRRAGNVSCWGESPRSDAGALLPEPVQTQPGVAEIRAGSTGSYCARGEAGWVQCWRFSDMEGEWTVPAIVDELAGARAIAMAGHDEVCAIAASGEIVCHNLDSGFTLALPGSAGTVELVGTALVACGRNEDGRWRCWNILPPMLETVGTFSVDVPSEVPLRELAVAGLRLCALREDDQVACALATDAMPALAVVEGLPP